MKKQEGRLVTRRSTLELLAGSLVASGRGITTSARVQQHVVGSQRLRAPGGRLSREEVHSRLPAGLPLGVASLIAETLNSPPSLLNTDWFGTTLMQGLLEWHERGFPEVRPFAESWLVYHQGRQEVAKCQCPPSRTLPAGRIPIATYAGHYGLAFACYEMYRQFGNPTAREVCLEVAKIILHQAARNRWGMVAHDDYADFAIPDTAYFVVRPLMLAASLDPECGKIFQEQALFQLRAYTKTFLVLETGLAKTVLLSDGLGKTYWTRASGWLMWAMTAALRHLPRESADSTAIQADLRRLAEGVARVQDESGGLHVWLDQPNSPLESTGTAMCAMALHESVRRGWLPGSFQEVAAKAWRFVCTNITDDGEITNAYTLWALPAERGELSIDERKMGWIPGTILRAANELTQV